MVILGIDPGTLITGYGVLESDGSRHQCLEYGSLDLPAKNPMPERLARLHAGISSLIAKYAIESMALEDLFHAVNVQSAMKLSQARGVIMLAAAQKGIPVFEYSPLEVKNSVVGYGRAEKTQVQQMVYRLLHLHHLPEPLDAADALAIAICHAQTSSVQKRLDEAKKRTAKRIIGRLSARNV
jgi:crossover junction endodeoxyribonuclease RuvC